MTFSFRFLETRDRGPFVGEHLLVAGELDRLIRPAIAKEHNGVFPTDPPTRLLGIKLVRNVFVHTDDDVRLDRSERDDGRCAIFACEGSDRDVEGCRWERGSVRVSSEFSKVTTRTRHSRVLLGAWQS